MRHFSDKEVSIFALLNTTQAFKCNFAGHATQAIPDRPCPSSAHRSPFAGLQTFVWCGRRDLNPHSLGHYPLKIACLPIPPLPRISFNLLANRSAESTADPPLLLKRRHVIDAASKDTAGMSPSSWGSSDCLPIFLPRGLCTCREASWQTQSPGLSSPAVRLSAITGQPKARREKRRCQPSRAPGQHVSALPDAAEAASAIRRRQTTHRYRPPCRCCIMIKPMIASAD